VSSPGERPPHRPVWARYRDLAIARPGGFPIASLLRPPADGEDEELFLERAREATALGPFGHHTHWTSPTHARPTGDGDPAEQVLREGRWLRERGLEPGFFCGGGGDTDGGGGGAGGGRRALRCTPHPARPSVPPPRPPP